MHYGPLERGPLRPNQADTFRSGAYDEVVTSSEVTLYRVYGGDAREVRAFWTRGAPQGPTQASLDLALDPKWGNDATHWVQIAIPPGTTLYEGAVAGLNNSDRDSSGPVSRFLGGGDQVLVTQRIPEAWVVQRGRFPEEQP